MPLLRRHLLITVVDALLCASCQPDQGTDRQTEAMLWCRSGKLSKHVPNRVFGQKPPGLLAATSKRLWQWSSIASPQLHDWPT
ncbi:hypothetical protein EJ05DRAFT_477489 [Pseudovirgaria hyperparasitica]|uniref:Secreted protein n=1 Tax=Pseudovirgaria hyperparasitica TaxID=470096 RepID=A0A6A6W430_9PEZI|nr:uncharacterized protein EJ05DRAFT_477489 [Pseudovirgaria hyperparasitica]KAF2756317.1 hypothetical protein EJ05DRAFT_477489 [Pseudovirgaria hyperparasitica]